MRRLACRFGALLVALALAGCGNVAEEGGLDGLQPIPMDFESQEGILTGTDAPSDPDGASGMDMPSAADDMAGNGTAGRPDEDKAHSAPGTTGKSGDMEAYQDVLRGEGEFLDGDSGKSLSLGKVRQMVTSDAGISIEPGDFTVVDLDQDGEPEVVLSLILNGNSTYGSLVLRCRDGIVHGYVFSQRAFYGVKTNGTFLASGGAADVGICKLAFDGADAKADKFTYSESKYDAQNNLSVSYYVEKKEVGAEEYDRSYGEWERIPDAKWHKLTEDNIDGIFLLWEKFESVSSSGNPGSPDALKGQIPGQSFDLSLDGWGEVTFAAFEPKEATSLDARGQVVYGDVEFKLIKDGEPVYPFPGDNEENIHYGQRFSQVLAVAFRDYDGDGREDILIILEYEYVGVEGSDGDVPFRQARAYTQTDGETAFKKDALLSEYLCYYTDSMAKMYEGVESYGMNYAVATSKTTWAVEGFAREVKQQILGGDFEGLCCNIVFPITVDGVTYQDEEAFLKADFVGNPNPEFLQELREAPCENMMANSQGIAMGNGIIWIGEVLNSDNHSSKGLKVVKLNGLTVQSNL